MRDANTTDINQYTDIIMVAIMAKTPIMIAT